MSSENYSTRKSSSGILKSRSGHDGYEENDSRQHQRIQIKIQNEDNAEDPTSANSESEFEKLKDLYHRECRRVNEKLVEKFGSQTDSIVSNPDEKSKAPDTSSETPSSKE